MTFGLEDTTQESYEKAGGDAKFVEKISNVVGRNKLPTTSIRVTYKR